MKVVQTEQEVEAEKAAFNGAIERVSAALTELAATSDIFGGHLAIAMDFMLHDSVLTKISDKQNAEVAVENAIGELKAMFESMDDEYMRERAADVVDVGKRIMAELKGIAIDKFSAIREPVVVVAEDLTPSDTAEMDFSLVRGFITAKGGVTSHVCIIARGLGIPALVGVTGILDEVKSGDPMIFDAATGDIYVYPDEATANTLREKAARDAAEQEAIEARATLPAVTKDGREVKVYANVGSVADIRSALDYKIDGVGLFRTEFLFMENTDFPSEEEQFEVYKEAITLLGKEMIIRTLDIGGDKALPYFEFEEEENPFLGWRAIRMCLSKVDMFKEQLRALLRASFYGPIRIMLPMIISVEEVEQVKAIIETCKDELRAEGKDFNENVPVGIMVETPAAVLAADLLAPHVDFFSIGTNDLTQYVLAVDRGNEAIEALYDSFHPAVMRAIARVIEAGKAAGIEVGMCGEFASDSKATEVLLGFGLDEYSMAANETARVKERIRNLSYADAQELGKQVLAASRVDEVKSLIASGQ